MSCMTLTASEITMATTQFARTACCESCWHVEEQFQTRPQPLRMNWVVVTDENGNRQLQMGWHADRAD